MKRLSILMALVATGACSSSNDAGPAHPVDEVALYGQMCARCHGLDGRGDAEMRKTMPTLRDFTDPQLRAKGMEELEAMIMGGKNQMPAFGGALSRPKIQHLGGYVRRLGLAAAGSPPPGAR
jgi:mono/diheme cytochrome c family protein